MSIPLSHAIKYQWYTKVILINNMGYWDTHILNPVSAWKDHPSIRSVPWGVSCSCASATEWGKPSHLGCSISVFFFYLGRKQVAWDFLHAVKHDQHFFFKRWSDYYEVSSPLSTSIIDTIVIMSMYIIVLIYLYHYLLWSWSWWG